MVGWALRAPHHWTRPAHDIKAADIGNFSIVFGEQGACLPFQGMSTLRTHLAFRWHFDHRRQLV